MQIGGFVAAAQHLPSMRFLSILSLSSFLHFVWLYKEANYSQLTPLTLCLDVVGFTSIHMCWSGLGWNLVQVLLQSNPTHVD